MPPSGVEVPYPLSTLYYPILLIAPGPGDPELIIDALSPALLLYTFDAFNPLLCYLL